MQEWQQIQKEAIDPATAATAASIPWGTILKAAIGLPLLAGVAGSAEKSRTALPPPVSEEEFQSRARGYLPTETTSRSDLPGKVVGSAALGGAGAGLGSLLYGKLAKRPDLRRDVISSLIGAAAGGAVPLLSKESSMGRVRLRTSVARALRHGKRTQNHRFYE